ncbi:MAG: domain protein beta Propeller [Armatimonadetes bacterium]|jgi:Tol biopolymer transport system component|nr:domain protein beta Propeller [Armatimonadota bacterium]
MPLPLLIAFATYRRRGDAGDIYFYEHDGEGQGKLLDPLPTEQAPRNRSDYKPSLCANGSLCAFAVQYRDAAPGELRLWDLKEKKLLPLPDRNPSGADAQPSLSADGRWLAFSGWRRPGGVGGYDVFLYDLLEKKLVPLEGVNTSSDEHMPTISGDGRYLAWVSNAPLAGDTGSASLSRICLYDRVAKTQVSLPGLAAPGHRDTEPVLSADGRLLAFASSRPTKDDPDGAGDVLLYDRSTAALIPLPGLNSAGHDAQPALSPGGRFIVFTSERLDGAGQRDLYLYDRRRGKLLDAPGLRDPGEEFEATITCLDPALDTVP